MTLLRLGVVGTSAKENEHRLPLHPEHLPGLDADLRARITLEHGYGERYGVSDADLAGSVAGFATRAELLADSDVVLLPKPQHEDVAAMHSGQVLWGWPHCVQDTEITQLSIDRRAHADRVRGDEPLDPRRRGRAARLPQEQRAGRLLLGAAGDGAGRHHRRLRPSAVAPW